jgi:hypothetical protein
MDVYERFYNRPHGLCYVSQEWNIMYNKSENIYWFHKDFGMRFGVELRNDPSDRIRKAIANAAKNTRISPWMQLIKPRLISLKYTPFKDNVDVIFTSKTVDGKAVELGYAVMHEDGNSYFLMNIDYLSGNLNLQSESAIRTFIHEWSHIWLFKNDSPDIRDILSDLLKKIKNKKIPLARNAESIYALSDSDGDELWAYMNVYLQNVDDSIKDAYWRIRKIVDKKVKNISEGYPTKWDKEEFENIKSYRGKVRYAESHLKKIGSGSARIVFEIDDSKVLKMAKNEKGVAQNETEIDWGMQRMYGDIITKMFDSSERAYWVEMEKASRAKSSDFKSMVGLTFREFSSVLNIIDLYLNNRMSQINFNERIEFARTLYDDGDSFLNRVVSLNRDFGILMGDLMRISSYGIVKRNGEKIMVVTDFGFTTGVQNDHYKTKR